MTKHFLQPKNAPLLLLCLLVILYLALFYGPIILHPNSYLFSSVDDGLKNYYTYAYYIKNNPSLINFDGMNYPYGESVMYTDNHPLMALVLKELQTVFPSVADYSVGILNLFLVFSYAFAAFVLFALFKTLKVEGFVAALGAAGICFLSPQLFRLTGHYALSYSFAIPLIIYLLLRVKQQKKGALFSLFFALLVLFFTHAYLGMIAAALVLSYAGIAGVESLLKKDWNEIKSLLKTALTSAATLGIFYVFVKATDFHEHRTTNPWGIQENHADFNTVFVPVYNSSNKLNQWLFAGKEQLWEGWSYIGIAAILGLIVFGLSFLFSTLKTRRIALENALVKDKTILYLLFGSVALLVFSMFFPFRLGKIHWLEHVAFLKQFRAIGRFAWAFYFMATIFSILVLNQIYLRLKVRTQAGAMALVILVFASFILEGRANQKSITGKLKNSSNLFVLNQNSAAFQADVARLDASKFQAIIPLPYFYIGSENFGKPGNSDIYQKTMLFSYHLDLPSFGSYLTRTSIKESKANMQLLAESFYPKKIEKDLPNRKPFLLVKTPKELTADETKFLAKAKLISKNESYELYSVDYDAVFQSTAKKEWNAFENKRLTLIERNGFLVSDSTAYFSFTDFKNQESTLSFSGQKGCFVGTHFAYNVVCKLNSDQLKPNTKYVARFWMYNQGENYGQDAMPGSVFFQKIVGTKIDWLPERSSPLWSHQINGDWSLVEIAFSTTDENGVYELIVKGSDNNTKPFYLDDLLIYEDGLDVYKIDGSASKKTLFYNNHRIPFSL